MKLSWKALTFTLVVCTILLPFMTVVSWNDSRVSADGGMIVIDSSQVSASSFQPNTDYTPDHVVDGNLDIESRWSAQGEGEWLLFDLLEPKTVTWLQMSFVAAESRASIFEVEVSDDGEQFRTVLDRTNSANVTGLQPFVISEAEEARYLRIVGYGNTSNLWNSYIEVELYEGTPPEVEVPVGPGEPGDYDEAELQPEFELVTVSSAAELTSALDKVQPGIIIELANGSYAQDGPFVVNAKHGTPAQPIRIRSAELGEAQISGAAYLIIQNSSYIEVEGLKFANSIGSSEIPNPGLLLQDSSYVSVLRNTFALDETEQLDSAQSHYLTVRGTSSHNRIAYNEFGPKSKIGAVVAYDGADGNISQYDVIEYNWFHHTGPRISNGLEAIRLGYSGYSLSSGFIKVQYNLFESADGDPEIVSVKSSDNIVRYNTFLNSQGQVTSRHGHRNSFYGNFFINAEQKSGVGGIRIYGNDHQIYNNYMEGLTYNAIHIDGGNYDAGSDGTGTPIAYNAGTKDEPNLLEVDLSELKTEDPDAWLAIMRGHWRAYRAQVYNNTIVGSMSGIIDGGRTYASVDTVVANNLIFNNFGRMYEQLSNSRNCERGTGQAWMYTPEQCTQWVGNIAYGLADVYHSQVPKTVDQIQEIDPLLVRGADGLIRLSAISPARDSAVLPHLAEEDMDGQYRYTPDVGADEYDRLTAMSNKPLTRSDVGPHANMEVLEGLSDLVLSEGVLNKAFSAEKTFYTMGLSNSVKSVSLTPIALDDDMIIKVSINGSEPQTVQSGDMSAPLNLIQGNSLNMIMVKVMKTSNGESQTYIILVER